MNTSHFIVNTKKAAVISILQLRKLRLRGEVPCCRSQDLSVTKLSWSFRLIWKNNFFHPSHYVELEEALEQERQGLSWYLLPANWCEAETKSQSVLTSIWREGLYWKFAWLFQPQVIVCPTAMLLPSRNWGLQAAHEKLNLRVLENGSSPGQALMWPQFRLTPWLQPERDPGAEDPTELYPDLWPAEEKKHLEIGNKIKYCEMRNMCCFKLLSFGVICYAGIDNEYN